MLTTLEKVGIVAISILVFQVVFALLSFIYRNIIAPKLRFNAVKLKETGKWAVVTGATDGLGKAYAEYLAKKSMNVVLISRSVEKLENVAREIETTYSVETKIIPVNFTHDESIYEDIEKQLLGLEIGVLINNVGMSYPYPEYFLDVKNGDEMFRDMIRCNVFSVTNMCKIVLPGMVERKRGVIVNVSSLAATIPSPMLSVYSATKAYIDKFSEDLQAEYSKMNVVIQCLLPGYVATKMSKIRRSTWMAPSPQKFVREACKTIGIHQRTTGYFPHTLLLLVVDGLNCISHRLPLWLIMHTMHNIRSRALKRTAQQ